MSGFLRHLLRLGFGLAAIGLSACGATSFEGGLYRGHGVQYRVGELGAGWSPLAVGDHNDLAWSNESAGAIVQVNSTCEADMDVPLSALTNHLLIGFTEREFASQETHPMDGREALITEVSAKLDGVPRSLILVVLKKDGCVYDLSLITPDANALNAARESFQSFIASFHTEGPST